MLNLEYIFYFIYSKSQGTIKWFINFIYSPEARLVFAGWIVLGIIFLLLTAVLLTKIYSLRKLERAEFAEVLRNLKKEAPRNERWEKILKYFDSENPSDWKLAILEADTLLDELVTRMGYQGDNLGEKLKSVEPSDFLTLPAAWEAHKVRNMIAHESDFFLAKREARRVIDLFEKVFSEFDFI